METLKLYGGGRKLAWPSFQWLERLIRRKEWLLLGWDYAQSLATTTTTTMPNFLLAKVGLPQSTGLIPLIFRRSLLRRSVILTVRDTSIRRMTAALMTASGMRLFLATKRWKTRVLILLRSKRLTSSVLESL